MFVCEEQTAFWTRLIWNATAPLIAGIASLLAIKVSTNLATDKERRQLLWSKQIDRLLALEELAGRLVEELATHSTVDASAPILKRFKQAAGRFARYDSVAKAVRVLGNTADRMFVAKRDHSDETHALRAELDSNLKKLLDECDQVKKRDKFLK